MLKKLIYVFAALVFISALFGGIIYYLYSQNQNLQVDEEIVFTIEEGSYNSTVYEKLHDKGVVKNRFFTKLYARLNDVTPFYAGNYTISLEDDLESVMNKFMQGATTKDEYEILTFIDGERLLQYAIQLEAKTGVSGMKEAFLELCSDEEYLRTLVSKYEYIDEDILNKSLYYALEGYLAPETYFFKHEDYQLTNVKYITNILIDQRMQELEKILNDYKFNDEITNVHELLTLGSIVQREANNYEDYRMVAGVFMNRLEIDMPLGSDVTTYYGIQVDMSERDLYTKEINEINDYNTRANFIGLPIGPINNPNDETLKAVLDYVDHDYMYFVSDKNAKMYYTKTYDEHLAIVKELKDSGLWFEY